ncbi:hypothetical protein YC2023_034184 [Brassica napus]
MVSSSSSSSSSEVKIVSECFIKPKTVALKSKEPYHLSPTDHVVLSFQYIQKGLLFLKQSDYDDATKPKDFMETLLQKLKDSLAATLVHFYPFAGRLSTLKTDNPRRSYSVFVDCNNSPGALDLSMPSWIYVTELVDGVFIGLSMNHSIGDGCTFWHFFNSFSDIFTNHNNLFCLKNPPIFREVSGPLCRLPYSPLDKSSISHQSESPVLKERMFHFSSETVRSLKSKANQDCNTTTISSLQSLTAVIWRSITRARKAPNDQETTCRFAADSRSRMDPPLPTNHVGFYVSATSTTAKNGDLLEKNGLGWAASKLHRAVTEHTGEKIASQIDRWLKSPPAAVHDPNVVHMGSSPRFDKYGCQFGMGKAVAVRSGKFDGKVSAYPGRERGGSIDLEVCLLPEFMEALESDQEFMSLVSSSQN